jgi:hypothetical protein
MNTVYRIYTAKVPNTLAVCLQETATQTLSRFEFWLGLHLLCDKRFWGEIVLRFGGWSSSHGCTTKSGLSGGFFIFFLNSYINPSSPLIWNEILIMKWLRSFITYSNLFETISAIHCTDLLDVQNILSAGTGISRQTEGHLFGHHLISKSVCVTQSRVIEASIVLCSVSSWLLMSNQPVLWTGKDLSCSCNFEFCHRLIIIYGYIVTCDSD